MSAPVYLTIIGEADTARVATITEALENELGRVPGVEVTRPRGQVREGARGIELAAAGQLIVTLLGTKAAVSLLALLKSYVSSETTIEFKRGSTSLTLRGRDLTAEKVDTYARALAQLSAN